MFFTGDHKKRKVVSLGGRRQQQQSASDARRARQARQREREQQDAARLLQGWWKQTHASLLERQRLRTELDALLASPSLSEDTAALERTLLLTTLLEYRASDSSVSSTKTTRDRVASLTKALVQPSTREAFVALLSTHHLRETLTNRLLHLQLAQPAPLPDLCAAFIGLVLPIGDRQVRAGMTRVLTTPKAHDRLVSHCNHNDTSSRTRLVLLSWLTVAVNSGSVECRRLLFHRFLTHQLPSSLSSNPILSGLILKALTSTEHALLPSSLPAPQMLALCENTTAAVSAKREHVSDAAFAAFAGVAGACLAVVHPLVVAAWSRGDVEGEDEDSEEPQSESELEGGGDMGRGKERGADHEDRDEAEEDDEAQQSTVDGGTVSSVAGEEATAMDVRSDGESRATTPAAQQQLRVRAVAVFDRILSLFSHRDILRLLIASLEAVAADAGSSEKAKKDSGEEEQGQEKEQRGTDGRMSVLSVYTQLVSLLRASPHQPAKNRLTQMLTELSAHDAFITALWRRVAPEVPVLVRMARAPYADLERWCSSTPAAIIALLCDIIHHHFVLVDDNDFWPQVSARFDGEATFRKFLAAARDVCVNLFLSAPNTAPVHVRTLRASVSQLLREMYHRDDRVQRLGTGFWTAPALQNMTEPLIRHLEAADFERPAEGEAEAEPGADADMHTSGESSGRGLTRQLADPSTRALVLRDLLQEIPFCVAFMDRVSVFRRLIATHMQDSWRSLGQFGQPGRKHLRVQRGRMYEDAFDQAAHDPMVSWTSPLSVTILDQDGLPEAGIDGGGLFREFLQEAVKEAFDPDRGLFRVAEDGGVFPNPDAHRIIPQATEHFRFTGKLLGQALHTGMLLDLPLAQFFLSKILGKRNIFCQLASRDEQLYRSLASLRSMSAEDLDAMELTFSVTQSELTGHRVVDLLPGGRDKRVTKHNLTVFLVYMGDYYLNREIERAAAAFREGVHAVVRPEWLYLFGPSELQMLISGTHADIDVDDMRRNTLLSGGFTDDHPTIAMFWRVVRGMSPEDRALLLKFITSCPRPPLQGFTHLRPNLAIRNALDKERLPTASTCVNLLKLPPYEDEDTLRSKLLTAIRSNSGFHLS